MSNFVIQDVPNFVLVVSGSGDNLRTDDGPYFINPLFEDIVQELGVQLDRSRESDPVHFFRTTRPRVKRVLHQYSFERFPRTLGELCGLFDYCDRLDLITGRSVFESGTLAQWQRLTAGLLGARTGMPHQPAVELYRRGDLAGLLAWHIDHNVLAALGKTYWHAQDSLAASWPYPPAKHGLDGVVSP